MAFSVLLLGCTNAGKTLLSRRLRHALMVPATATASSSEQQQHTVSLFSDTRFDTSTSSTTGVDPCTCWVPLPSASDSGSRSGGGNAESKSQQFKRRQVLIKEVGGPMKKSWPRHFHGSNLLLFVIDQSARWQLSASMCELFALLEEPELASVPFIVVLTKTDACSSGSGSRGSFSQLSAGAVSNNGSGGVAAVMSREEVLDYLDIDAFLSPASSHSSSSSSSSSASSASTSTEADRRVLGVFSTSALTGEGVQELLDAIARVISTASSPAASASKS